MHTAVPHWDVIDSTVACMQGRKSQKDITTALYRHCAAPMPGDRIACAETIAFQSVQTECPLAWHSPTRAPYGRVWQRQMV